MFGSEREPLHHRILIEYEKYQVRMMDASWPKVLELWGQLKKFRSLFSDLTRNDLDNFVRYVSNPDTFWIEIWEGDDMVGLVVLENIHRIVDADAHVLFLDRNILGRVPICRLIIKWIFAHMPFNRLTVEIPDWYENSVSLVRNLGFKTEGKKRQAVLIGGRWSNVYIFGLTRDEAEV